MRSFARFSFLLAVILIAMGFPSRLRAQVNVDLSIRRTIFVAYEPLLATVRITNLSGQKLMLADVEGKKWFGFQIETLAGSPVPPINPDYEIAPLELGEGESITRTVNLTQLYPLSDFGSYRIRASVYSTQLSSFFSSPPLTVEVTEGRLVWQQTVGVPAAAGIAPGNRTISLLTHRLEDKTDLYLRIEDKSSGIVYCTHRLGDLISYGKPDIQLDGTNGIHVLQNNVPREFIYSKVGLDGTILSRLSYNAPKTRPQLIRQADGSVIVIGAVPYDPKATPTPGTMAKLSDRPAPLPIEATQDAGRDPKHPSPAPTAGGSPTPRRGTGGPVSKPKPTTTPRATPSSPQQD